MRTVRDRILDAAAELIKRDHVNNITMTQIADAADVSRMTMYRYFQDKYEIEFAIYIRDIGPCMGQYDKDGDLKRLMTDTARMIHKNKSVYINIFQDRDHQNSFFESWMEHSRNIIFDAMDPNGVNKDLSLSVDSMLYGIFQVTLDYLQDKIDMDLDEVGKILLKHLDI